MLRAVVNMNDWSPRLATCTGHATKGLSKAWGLSFLTGLVQLLSLSACVASTEPGPVSASANQKEENPLSGATILIIRHAEKPASGSGLSAEGQARAEAYVRYFQSLRLDGQPLHLDYLVAADDSDHSQRSRLTLEPLAHALGLKPDLRFQARRPQDLAWELRARPHGKTILVCWHHREIPALLAELGVDPDRLLPNGQWPDKQFAWMLRLSYDEQGRLKHHQTKRIKEHLMPGD